MKYKNKLLAALLLSTLASVSFAYDPDVKQEVERQNFINEINKYTYQNNINHFDLLDLARNGNKEAAWYASQMYHRGILVEKDLEKSKEFAALAGLNGNPDAQDYLSRHPALTRSEQLAWSNEAAASDHPKSLYYLGRSYLTGDGVPSDLDLAMFYLARSSSLGYEPARRLRQDILDQQIKLPSFGDILENARNGQIDSLRRLAEAYRNGVLIDRDIAKANRIDQQIDVLVNKEDNHRSNLYK